MRCGTKHPLTGMALLALLLATEWSGGTALAQGPALPAPPPLVGDVGRRNFEQRPQLYRLDDAGVIQAFRSSPGWYYNPLIVATYTLSLYGAWYRGDASAYGPMVIQAAWLRDNAVQRIDPAGRPFLTHEYPFPLPGFKTPAGWTSALAAGEAISALFAVSRVTGDETLAAAARAMLLPFDLLMAKGGYRTVLADRLTVWFEEVAHPRPRVRSS